MPDYGKFLRENGYVVVPTSFDVVELRKEFDDTLSKFPEFKRHPPVAVTRPGGVLKYGPLPMWVRGGFAQLSNPASYHNPFVRRMRQWCMAHVLPVASQWIADEAAQPPKDWKFEQMIDGMILRQPGQAACAESWHMDLSPDAKPTDVVLGGWVNFDDTDQFLSCIPKTHKHQAFTKGNGFSSYSKQESQALSVDPRRTRVPIPPGSILVFYENLTHEVVSSKSKKALYRLHLAWRLTLENESLIPGMPALIAEQGVIPKKSKQIPPMWPVFNWTNSRPQLEAWSVHNMKARVVHPKVVSSGKCLGAVHMIVDKEMESLAHYSFPLYPAYTDHEKRMLRPGKRFRLLMPNKTRLYKTYSL